MAKIRDQHGISRDMAALLRGKTLESEFGVSPEEASAIKSERDGERSGFNRLVRKVGPALVIGAGGAMGLSALGGLAGAGGVKGAIGSAATKGAGALSSLPGAAKDALGSLGWKDAIGLGLTGLEMHGARKQRKEHQRAEQARLDVLTSALTRAEEDFDARAPLREGGMEAVLGALGQARRDPIRAHLDDDTRRAGEFRSSTKGRA